MMMAPVLDVLQKAQQSISGPSFNVHVRATLPSTGLAPADRYRALWWMIAFLGESYADFLSISRKPAYWPRERKTACKLFTEC